MLRRSICIVAWFIGIFCTFAQEERVIFTIGEKFNDKYRYSNMLAIADDGNEGTVVVRAYYTGIILEPK